ncbi:galactokinase [Fusobacterium naviforme]|nr:galactokinase [Fusobacterium naviforme]PSL11276.1 galactokinase [Fusobacterium naviforme]STO28651.1 Galactokinase [Fusobacterium naviforme]
MNGQTLSLEELYGEDAGRAAERYRHLEEKFREHFGERELRYFSAPGRTEIIGNHTDHNGGRILAASITLDTICAAARTEEPVITIVSEGYRPITLDLRKLPETPKECGSISLVAGIAEAAQRFGFRTGGFSAYVTTEVIAAAGVSSSASFEMLICAIINHFYNDGAIDCAHYARMGQYAENHWWNKASGLMDQMACAVGGTILLDFSDGVKYERVDFSFDQLGMDLFIINTGKGHADLGAEYSAMPNEMREVARLMGGENLCEADEAQLLCRLPELREKLQNDRALLRALHYYEECSRVDRAVEALRAGEADRMLELITEGGNSSWKWLQNGYVAAAPREQSIPLMLALSELYIRRAGQGACRIHGGGFAGVIMVVLPKAEREHFIEYMTPYVGEKNIYVMGIRRGGAVEVRL